MNESNDLGIIMHEMSAEFSQEGTDGSKNVEVIKLKVEAMPGGEPYFTMSTRRWTFDSADDIRKLCEKMLESFNLHKHIGLNS